MRRSLKAAAALGGSAFLLLSALPSHAATAITGVKGKTYKGSSVATPFGPVQVSITVSNRKVLKATAIAYPSADHESAQINSYAIPALQQQAAAAQSADIDGVSGASWTSYGFKQSLQSALTKAGIARVSS